MTAHLDRAVAEHSVAVYGTDAELARLVVPYVRTALAHDETVVVLVSERAAAVLRGGLGSDARRVRWELPGIVTAHLGRMFESLRTYFAAQALTDADTRLVVEGDVGPCRGRAEAFLRLEAASNDVHGAFGVPWLCLYDRTRYPAQFVDRLGSVHPLVLGPDGAPVPSPSYSGADAYLAAHPGPLSIIPAAVELDLTVFRLADLAAVRHEVVRAARDAGMDGEGTDDVALAVTEVVTNALEHGSAPCRTRLWHIDGVLVVRVDDHGSGDGLPVHGFRPRRLGATGTGLGVGLWVTRLLADSVHIEVGGAGASVELHFPVG